MSDKKRGTIYVTINHIRHNVYVIPLYDNRVMAMFKYLKLGNDKYIVFQHGTNRSEEFVEYVKGMFRNLVITDTNISKLFDKSVYNIETDRLFELFSEGQIYEIYSM